MRWRDLLPSTVQVVLTPREKARLLVATVQEQTLACLQEQRHLFMMTGSQDRRQRLRELAETFLDDEAWCPAGLCRADIECLPPRWMIGLVHAVVDGTGISGYEQAITERILRASAPEAEPHLPEVPVNEYRGDRITQRRSYPRRRMS